MKIKQTQVDAALQMTLEHHDESDIRIQEDYRTRWGRNYKLSVVGHSTALEEFELYLAATFLTADINGEVPAHGLLKAIMDVRELRREDEYGPDDVVFYYPHFELDN